MRRATRTFAITALVAFSLSASLASTAFGAVELGDECTAVTAVPGTAVQSAVTGNFTYTAPTDGIITSWGMGFPATTGYSGKLLVLHPTGVANTYTVVTVTNSVVLVGGLNQTPAQIAVKAGDVIAAVGNPSTLVCGAVAGNDIRNDSAATNPGVGSTINANGGPVSGLHIALFASLEKDADNDGFGDDTQDLCSLNPAVQQVACPVVKLGKYVVPPSNKLVELIVSSTTTIPVTVKGSVSIKAAKAKKSSASSTFNVGPVTKTVGGGALVSFKLKFSKKLRAALKAYPKSKKFNLKLTVTGVGIGNTDTQTQTVKLRGTK